MILTTLFDDTMVTPTALSKEDRDKILKVLGSPIWIWDLIAPRNVRFQFKFKCSWVGNYYYTVNSNMVSYGTFNYDGLFVIFAIHGRVFALRTTHVLSEFGSDSISQIYVSRLF